MRRRVVPLNDFEADRPAINAISASMTPRPVACWPTPIQNGRVINILSITRGLADIDTNGDGLADDATRLVALGITEAERQQLAALYPQAPKQLWRVPVTHFSPWDFNWPFGPPTGATAPNQPVPAIHPTSDPCEKGGSIIECQNQVLGERIGVPGTPYTLNYRSSRVPGHGSAYTVNIAVSGASVPADLRRIDLIIEVAGRQFLRSLPAASNQTYNFTWDGKNAYGQTVQGKQPVTVHIGYVYGGVYLTSRPGTGYDVAFGHFSYFGTPVTGNREEREVILWQIEKLSIGGFDFDARSQGLGGWDLNIHNTYDPVGKVILFGDGSWRSADTLGTTAIETVAGDGRYGGAGTYDDDGYFLGDYVGPATGASLESPVSVTIGPDGSIYIADDANYRIRRTGPDGIITTVAGIDSDGYSGDGGPATSASIGFPGGVAAGYDGSIYISDWLNNRIRRVGPDGIMATVAGNGNSGYSGDGGPATSASISFPRGVAVGSDGNIYISDSGNNRIRRVNPDGIISTVAGNGIRGYSGDGGPATSASLLSPDGVAIGPDGSIYINDGGNNRIRRVGPDGVIATVAGNGNHVYFWGDFTYCGYSGDGGLATSTPLCGPTGVAVGPDGSVYIADMSSRIHRVRPDGIITSVAGNGSNSYGGDGGPAANALLYYPYGIAVAPDNSLVIADSANGRIRRVASAWLGVSISDFSVPSEDGSQIYIFNASGRHLRTLNALTGAALFSFGYDSGGRLLTVTDGAGNITTIERDASGNPTGIVAPFGQHTTLAVDANGYLASMTNPAGESTRMSYNDGGLMTTYTDPKGNIHKFAYDANGLLVRDDNPAGGYMALAGTSTPSTKQEVLTTALGRITSYLTEYLSTGDQRLTITTPAGAQSVMLAKTDGSNQNTMTDGTTSVEKNGTDPRFGALVYLPASTTVKTPSGLTQTTTLTRTATLVNPADLLSLTSQTDTLNINNRLYTKAYNASSKAFTLTTPTGRSSSATIDSLGRPVSLLPAAGLTPVNYGYDSQGFLTTASQGSLVTTYGYDTLKRLSSVTNANGQSLGFAYDSADRVSKLTLPSGRSYQFTYDANGNWTSITMPNGAVHKLGYTVINLGSGYAPPGNLPYAWQYSLDQEWTSTTLPSGRTVNAGYDSGGRPTGIVYPEASVGILHSDKTDRVSYLIRTSAINGTQQQIAYSYDGSLVTGRTFSGVANGAFTYTYDNNFFLKQIKLVSGANTITTPITRDADGLVTGYGPFAFTRSGPARAVSGISGTALNVAVTYDSLGRVASRTHTVNGLIVYTIQITYDNRGNISRKVETMPGVQSNTRDYTYDADGQLTAVNLNGAAEELYSYDVNGNRTSYSQPGYWTVTASFDAQDRIQQQSQTSYQFNPDGQMSQRNSDTFQYSAQGELLQATVTGQAVTYAYDGMGRRVTRADSAGTSQYLYGDLNNPFRLTAMRDSAGVLTAFYHDEAGLPFAMDKGGTRYYIAADQVGTPRVVSDSAGNVVKITEWDSYGRPTLDTNIDFILPVGFAGGLADAKTGLVRFGYRDYEPATGRWTAKDPMFFKGGQGNVFGYVQNNPVNRVDPMGLYWFRQPWQTPGVVGRPDTPVPPGGPVSEFIEQYVPAGYTFGELHDSFVGAATSAGFPDWLVDPR